MVTVSNFEWQVRVYYEDTDAGAVVYHSQYLNFMERARTEALRSIGFEQDAMRDNLGVLFVVHSMQIKFIKPAKFNDLLMVSTDLSRIGLGSMEFMQKISVNQQALVEANVKVACVDAQLFKPVAIPKQLKQKMEQV